MGFMEAVGCSTGSCVAAVGIGSLIAFGAVYKALSTPRLGADSRYAIVGIVPPLTWLVTACVCGYLEDRHSFPVLPKWCGALWTASGFVAGLQGQLTAVTGDQRRAATFVMGSAITLFVVIVGGGKK